MKISISLEAIGFWLIATALIAWPFVLSWYIVAEWRTLAVAADEIEIATFALVRVIFACWGIFCGVLLIGYALMKPIKHWSQV